MSSSGFNLAHLIRWGGRNPSHHPWGFGVGKESLWTQGRGKEAETFPRLSDGLIAIPPSTLQEGRWNDSPCNQTLPSICKKPGRVSQEKEEDDHGCRKVRATWDGSGSGCSTALHSAQGFRGPFLKTILGSPDEQHPEHLFLRAVELEHSGAAEPLTAMVKSMGRNWDTKHMHLCTLSKTFPIRQPWLPAGMFIFFPLASLCAKTQKHLGA